MLRFIDLFSGTGGIRLGFEQALKQLGISHSCVTSAEIDKAACATYELNFGKNPYCDIKQLDDIPPFDVLLAGFPCQSFSYAGRQLGFADTRGTLFFEVERLLARYKPKLCFLENVRGLTTHDGGRTFQTIIDHIKALGYNVEYRLLNSSNYGVPQNRVRVYIICALGFHPRLTMESDTGASDSHRFKTQAPDFFTQYEHKVVKEILEDNPPSRYDCSTEFINALKKISKGDLSKLHGIRLIDTRNGNSIHSWNIGLKGECSPNEINFMDQLIANRRRHDFGIHQDGKALTMEQIKSFYKSKDVDLIIEGLLSKGYLRVNQGKYNPVCGNMSFEVFKFLDPESISITLTASDTNRLGIFHRNRVRRLTPRECARLQGYPDSYILHPSDSAAYKQLGNAVSVPVIERFFLNLLGDEKAKHAIQNCNGNDKKIPQPQHSEVAFSNLRA
ncbi:MAG: DNA (cytosine-5-)-methyltransferase [Victivallales bacterium]